MVNLAQAQATKFVDNPLFLSNIDDTWFNAECPSRDTEEEWFNTERIRDNAGEWLEAEFPDISDDSTLQSLDSTIARASNLKRRINNILYTPVNKEGSTREGG